VNPLNEHLSDDAFVELSLGESPNAKVAAHLENCAACREELDRFQESVGSFEMASLAWSEEKSGELPALRPAANKADATRPSPRLIWVTAMLLAIGVAVPATKMHFSTLHEAEVRDASVADEDVAGLNSPEQIAKDNQLMADVNFELEHSQAILLSQYDQQRGVRAGTGVTETGKRSR
jgi:hypothetical protein